MFSWGSLSCHFTVLRNLPYACALQVPWTCQLEVYFQWSALAVQCYPLQMKYHHTFIILVPILNFALLLGAPVIFDQSLLLCFESQNFQHNYSLDCSCLMSPWYQAHYWVVTHSYSSLCLLLWLDPLLILIEYFKISLNLPLRLVVAPNFLLGLFHQTIQMSESLEAFHVYVV